MRNTYGIAVCIEPNSALESCLRLGLPTDWHSLPNQFSNPLGHRSGVGHILLARAGLDSLDLTSGHDLVMSLADSEVAGSGYACGVTHKNLHVVLAHNITPGLRDDPDACYLVALADRRRLLRHMPIDRAYNVRSTPASATYFSATMNGPDPWTWAQMIGDIWTTVGISHLGSYPGLGFTPDGTPEDFSFYQHYALDALANVLDHVGCTLKLDTQTDTFGIVRIGVSDSVADRDLDAVDKLRLLDAEFVEPSLGRYPQYVRVLFPRHRTTPDTTGASPYHSVDTLDPSGTPSGVLAGTHAIIYDGLPAAFDSSGTLTNSAALSTRAMERSADFFRRLRLQRLRRTYGLPLDEFGLRPGSKIRSIRHGDRGRGLVTEINAVPELPADNLLGKPIRPLPLSVDPRSTLTVDEWTTDQTSYAVPAAVNTLYVSSSISVNIDSLILEDNRKITFINTGDEPIVFLHESTAEATATRRFEIPGGSSLYLSGGDTVTFIQDATPTTGRIRLLETTGKIHRPVQTATITTSQNNYVVDPNISTLLLTVNGTADLTGLALGSATTPGTPGLELTIFSKPTSTSVLTLKHNSGSSSVGNRFDLPDSLDIDIYPGTSVRLTYSSSLTWILIGCCPPEVPWRPAIGTLWPGWPDFPNFVIIPGRPLFPVMPDGPVVLRGLVGLPVGMPFVIWNPKTNADDLTLTHLDPTSSPGNQFEFTTGVDEVLTPGTGITVINDGNKIVDIGGSLALVPDYPIGLQQIADLADPAVDGILFWDDSAGEYAYLTAGSGLSITGTTLTATAADEKAKVSSNDTTAGYLNGKLIAGTGVTLTENTDGGNETLTIAAAGGGGGVTEWLKVATKTYVQLGAAALTNDVEVYSLPTGACIHSAVLKTTVAFAIAGISYALALGIAGTLNRYIGNYDGKAAVSGTNFAGPGGSPVTNNVPDIRSFTAATSIRLEANGGVNNLDTATAGSVDVWLLLGTLP